MRRDPRAAGVYALAGGYSLVICIAAAASDAAAETPAPAPATACKSAGEGCFLLTGLQIDGASAVTQAEFAPLYEPYLTRYVNHDDIEAIATAITDLYRKKGYFLSRAFAPAQMTPEDGVARVVVIEGRISEIAVEGSAKKRVAAMLRGLDKRSIITLADLDRRLALAADTPGVVMRSRIEPIAQSPGKNRLVVSANYSRVQAYASLDNRGSHEAGPLNSYVRLAWNGVLGGDQIALGVFTTPAETDEFTQGTLTYQYAFRSGVRVTAETSVARASPGPTSLSAGLDNDFETLSLRAEEPLLRRRHDGLWLTAALDARDVRREGGGVTAYKDRVRVVRAGVRGFREREGNTTSFWSTASFGLDGLGASPGPSPERSRPDAKPQTVKLTAGASRYQQISKHWAMYASADGQWSDDPLLVSEEFAIGGQPYGRAYDYGEISGDRGLAGLAELRVGYDPPSKLVSYAQAYAFADAGKVWNFNTSPGDDSLAISSAGLGVRVNVGSWLSISAEFAKPLSRAPAENHDKDWRPLISISMAR